MTVREVTQQIEHQTLSQFATFADKSKGRANPEIPDDLRTCFQRDRDRIIHSKSFRRLKQKTQVFLSPEGDHYRTRLTHTLEVAQIARTIACALRLNENLTEAIALGHDLGHTPFGHAGERALNQLNPNGFKHYLHSVRVVDLLEKDGKGLNLTWEVRNGISTHTKGEWAATNEGKVVRYADRIAYMNHDIEDAIAAGVLEEQALPSLVHTVLGNSKSERIATLIYDIVNSTAQNIAFSPPINEAYETLHEFMYSTVYVDKVAKREEQKVEKVIEALYTYFSSNKDKLPELYQTVLAKEGIDRAVTDYIASMSDSYAIRMFENLFVPKSWQVF